MTLDAWAENIEDILNRRETCVLGLPFDALTEQQALIEIIKSAEQKRRCFLSTPNLNFVISSLRSAIFFDSVCASNLSVADGMPLVLVSKLVGENLPERVSGSGLFEILMQRAASEKTTSVFFFGGDPGIANQAAEALNRSDNSLVAAGALDPGRGSVEEMSSAEIINQINTANPDIVVVALGAAKGQEWIMRNREQLNAPVLSHLGAVVNFVAGNVKRAPRFWQRLGVEWIWRTLQEPRLAKRYASDGLRFLSLLATTIIPLSIYRKLLLGKFMDTGLQYNLIKLETSDGLRISLSGIATAESLGGLRQVLTSNMSHPQNVDFDLQNLKFGDGHFFALLLRLRTLLSANGLTLRVYGSTKPLNRLARLYLISKERWRALENHDNLAGQ